MLASDKSNPEIAHGLDAILEDFRRKKEFLIEVKQNNKNIGRDTVEPRGVHSSVIKQAIDEGNIPLPVLLKIRNGVLYLPSLYTMTEGLTKGLRDAMPNLQSLYKLELFKVIFQRNQMSDKLMAQLLLGIRSRPEFESFTSQLNEIGMESATQLCNLIDRKNQDPH